MTTAKTTAKPEPVPNLPVRKVLLVGGGGCHDYKACCPVLKRYLRSVPEFEVDYVAEDLDAFLAERLAAYDLAVLYHTGGQLTVDQKRGLVEWVSSGKGFVGIHGAADSFKNSPEYLAMIGGVFMAHPCQREYIVGLNENSHPATSHLQGYSIEFWEKWPVYEYKVHDEQYLLNYDPRVKVLASTLFRGRLWPVAWVKPWGAGKVFYLALGHNVDGCRNPFFKQIFTGGAKWVADGQPYPEEPRDRYAIS